MNFNVCECAETRRNLEREKESNNPCGLICFFLGVGTCLFPHTSVYAAVACNGNVNATTIAGSANDICADQWGYVRVLKVRDRSNNAAYYYDPDGTNRCKLNSSGGTTGNVSAINDTQWCRIAVGSDSGLGGNYAGSNWYASKCDSGCTHIERNGCDNFAFKYNEGNSRSCSSFYFGPVVKKGSTTINWASSPNTSVSIFDNVVYTKNDLASANATFTVNESSDPWTKKNNAVCTGASHTGNVYAFRTYAWDVSACKFQDKWAPNRLNGAHCANGLIAWGPHLNASKGDAGHGFYIEYNTADAQFECLDCDLGWTGRGSNCDSCDVAGHWNCSNGTPQCYRGYELSSYNTCDQADHFDCTGSNWNNCSCRSGFSNNGTDGRICGPTCKENFTLSDDGQYCNCLPPYTLNVGDPDIPEDDTCGFAAGPYEDSTGWFTLISDDPNVCSSQQ